MKQKIIDTTKQKLTKIQKKIEKKLQKLHNFVSNAFQFQENTKFRHFEFEKTQNMYSEMFIER